MRILIAGTGSIGRRHAANLQALRPDARFVLLRRGAQQDDWSRQVAADVVGSVEEAIALRPDCAVVATPSARHADVLPALIGAGLPLYVEKPVVTSPSQVRELRELIRSTRYSAPSLAGCNLRYLPSLRRVHGLLAEGRLGRLVRAVFEAGQWLPDWRPSQDYRESYSARAADGGGVIFDLVHELDAVRWLLGEFPRVEAAAGRHSGLELETEDCAAVLLHRDAGPVVSVNLDYVSRRVVRRYHFVGSEASLTWDLPAQEVELASKDRSEHIDCGAGGFDVAATYRAAMREFLTAVSSGGSTTQDVLEGLATAELAMRAKEAAGSWK